MNKVESIESALPLDKKIKSLYSRDELSLISYGLEQAQTNVNANLELFKDELEKTKLILNSIQDGILAVDYYNNILFSNDKIEEIFNLDSAIVTDRPKLWKLLENQPLLKSFEVALKESIDVRHTAIKIGEKNFYNVLITPLTNNKEEITGAMAVFHDVSEHILTEKMRVDFVANVSHEIRTPLTSIKGFSQLLANQQNLSKEEASEFTARILENSERLLLLFNDLLNLSVIESQSEIGKENIDLSSMLSSIQAQHKSRYLDKDITWYNTLTHNEYVGNYQMIEQAISNIFDNAIKYHPHKQITIKSIIERRQNELTIQIIDDGDGIPEEHLKRIFERFYRVSNSRSNENAPKGTGIGLSIVKHIINKHDGQIRVESVLGKGTSFLISLPLK